MNKTTISTILGEEVDCFGEMVRFCDRLITSNSRKPIYFKEYHFSLIKTIRENEGQYDLIIRVEHGLKSALYYLPGFSGSDGSVLFSEWSIYEVEEKQKIITYYEAKK